MHHLARHSVACFLTRGDLVGFQYSSESAIFSFSSLSLFLKLIVSADSLFTGKKGLMFLRGFGLIQIGQLIMETGYGYHAHHFSTRYEDVPPIFCKFI